MNYPGIWNFHIQIKREGPVQISDLMLLMDLAQQLSSEFTVLTNNSVLVRENRIQVSAA